MIVPAIQWLDFISKTLHAYASMPFNVFTVFSEQWIETDNGKGLMHYFSSNNVTTSFVKTSPHGNGEDESNSTYRAVIEDNTSGKVLAQWDNVDEKNVMEVLAKHIELNLAESIEV
jgi:hypothetical protein